MNKTRTKQSPQPIIPLRMTSDMIENAWVKNMGHFLYHLDPDVRKKKEDLNFYTWKS